MNEFTEMEFKYRADDIKLADFNTLMNSLNPLESLEVAGWDEFYVRGENEFLRFRRDPFKSELTIKQKTSQANNWNRVEVDVPIVKDCDVSIIDAFANAIGFERAGKLYKWCQIYWLHNVNFVYYIVTDSEMKEVGRFIEVEVNKDGNGGFDLLNIYETQLLSKLGLKPQNRLKKSLFELFIK